MQGVHVIDHPLVQHKLTIMRDKETSTAGFRRLLREIALLLCYEVTRDLELTTTQIETPLATMEAPILDGKKLVFASILRAGNGLLEGMLDLVPVGARRPYRHLPRPRDAGAGRVLLQGAGGPRRPPGHRRRSDARDRQLGDRRDRAAEGARRPRHPLRLPARGARGHRALPALPSRHADLHRRDRRATSTRRATSSPASATPATACTGRSEAGRQTETRPAMQPVRAIPCSSRSSRPEAARP